MSGRSFTAGLWSDIEDVYAAILVHPFIAGVQDGTLPRERFRYFLLQDVRYLQVYARALSSLGGRAPVPADTEFFVARSAEAIAAERLLHEDLLGELGLDEHAVATTEESPTTLAYTSYLLATVHGGSFVEGLAAILPCFWIYREVGKELLEHGSPEPLYHRWIETYASPEYGEAVDGVLALADRIGPTLGTGEVARAHEHFATVSRYEWMFWEAAWREEQWPIGLAEGA